VTSWMICLAPYIRGRFCSCRMLDFRGSLWSTGVIKYWSRFVRSVLARSTVEANVGYPTEVSYFGEQCIIFRISANEQGSCFPDLGGFSPVIRVS